MPTINPLQTKAGAPPLPAWYQCYFLAVLEADESKVLLQIERAAKAITDRLVQLRCGAWEYPQEFQDLNCVLTFLALLSENIDSDMKSSYEFNRQGIAISP